MKNKKGTAAAPVILALFLSVVLSVTVWSAASYDSSTDPVVSYSGMQSYVASFVAEQLKTVNTAIGNLQNSLSSLQQSLKSLTDNFTTLSGTVSSQSDKITGNSSAISGLESRVNALENAAPGTAPAPEIPDYSAAISALESSVGALGDRLDAVESENGALRDRLDKLENARGEIMEELQSISERLTDISASEIDLELLRERCRKLSAELDGIARALDDIYTPVTVPAGAQLRARDGGSLLVILTDGSAAVVLPGSVTDLSEGWVLDLAAEIPAAHSILLTGNGTLSVTSADEAVFMVGGEYEIVTP